MGETQKKTYTAPDGSVYRVEDDGSVTKIKSGRAKANEPPSKYQISPDGKIYRVESDGSVTYLGNAEERHVQYTSADHMPKHERKKNWGWLVFLVIIIMAGCAGIFIFNQRSSSDAAYNNIEPMQEAYPKTSSEVSTEQAAYQSQEAQPATETPANEQEQWAFISDGNYYGRIGNSDIHGNLSLATEFPSGTLYYSNSGNGNSLQIYGSSDGRDWNEYYNDEATGTIHFDFWDLAYKNFARGTYTRYSDGKQFAVELYKTNF